MKWVTREKARADRIARPWLISRFIDKEPTITLHSQRIRSGVSAFRDRRVGLAVQHASNCSSARTSKNRT
ncbi:MAG: hypothetical protein DMD91_02495 [Candidatus Rokuibacteriota bacterium]|nr:MAG: hypothetical protein DMD91_02495 [Candidatus Rokubacteria bacterium]